MGPEWAARFRSRSANGGKGFDVLVEDFHARLNLRTLSRKEMPLKFICSLLAVLSCLGVAANAGQFEVLGVPVKSVLIMGAAVGVDEKTN